MIEDPKAKTLKPFDFSHLMENVPKVKMLDYDIDNIQFNPPIDSSDMDVSHWQDIARSIAEHYEKYDGFVVLHGTDTMAYTASALSFMLGNLAKPVIITGSQLPIGEVRTDGEENLITALQIAADRDADGNPTVREVAILFENFLWRGNRSTKRSADNFNAFKSNNYPELAKIGLGIHFNHNVFEQAIAPSLQSRHLIDVYRPFPGAEQTCSQASAVHTGHKRRSAPHLRRRQRPHKELVYRRCTRCHKPWNNNTERHSVRKRRRTLQPIHGRRLSLDCRSRIGPRPHLRGSYYQNDVPLRPRSRPR